VAALALALVLGGCTAGEARDAGPPDPPASSDPADTTQDDAEGAAGDDESDDAVAPAAPDATPPTARAPEVPPLHPAIDDLPGSIVTLVDGDARIEVDVKVAADDASRRRGLMEVTELPDGVGMLFVFEVERRGGFWMWNTLIPLDIGFVGADGRVHTVATMVPCEEDEPAACPITGPEQPYVAALEVPAGWFARVDLGAGAELSWSEPVPPAS
jgi:uncharacterized membrane protein (UPF0127 family)